MKIERKIFAWCLVVLIFASCEVIREEDRYVRLPDPVVSSARTNVLIEFTGFRCVNCPTASETAHDLMKIYGEQLIVVAMHPASNPFTQGKYDYTCPESDGYYQQCGGTAQTPFPTGSINLEPYEGAYFISPTEWASCLNRLVHDSVNVAVSDVDVSMDKDRKLQISSSLKGDSTNLQTVYWLVEDSICGVQAMPDGSVNTAYYHRHVFRGVVDREAYVLPEQYDAPHCSMVAVLMDDKQQIINAKQTKIKIDE